NALEFRGEAPPIAEDVEMEQDTGTAIFSVSRNNILVYTNQAGGWASQPTWFDRFGKEIDQLANHRALFEPGSYHLVDLSADERFLLVDAASGQLLVNLITGVASRFGVTESSQTIFSPDSKYVTYIQTQRTAPISIKDSSMVRVRPNCYVMSSRCR